MTASSRLRFAIAILPAVMFLLYELAGDRGAGLAGWSRGLSFVPLLALVLLVSLVLYRLTLELEREVARRNSEIVALRAMIDERERLSRELHDGSAQLLAALLTSVDAIRLAIGAGNLDAAAAQLDALHEHILSAYADARDALVGLRVGLRDADFHHQVDELARQLETRTGVAVEIRFDPACESLAPAVRLQAVRIVGEALTNIQKHAHASRVLLQISASSGKSILISVQDDGVGLGEAEQRLPGAGFGLQVMRERAESVGGWLTVVSEPGKGTTVVAELPIAA